MVFYPNLGSWRSETMGGSTTKQEVKETGTVNNNFMVQQDNFVKINGFMVKPPQAFIVFFPFLLILLDL